MRIQKCRAGFSIKKVSYVLWFVRKCNYFEVISALSRTLAYAVYHSSALQHALGEKLVSHQ